MYKSDHMSAWNREVLVLYRRLLRLHAALPPDLRALGEGYLREEFRRHRGGADVHVTAFKKEWSVSRAASRDVHAVLCWGVGGVCLSTPVCGCKQVQLAPSMPVHASMNWACNGCIV